MVQVGVTPGNAVEFTTIPAVTPLDLQFGAYPLKTVPDALWTSIFGPDGADKDNETTPASYAILDAARLPDGEDIIERCGLRHKCLFAGAAAQDFASVAPYLVELTQEAEFTRRLFTHSPDLHEDISTAHLWHKDPAIFLRCDTGFDALWRHLRKFVKMRDAQGSWLFFRFWEPSVLMAYLSAKASDPAALARFATVEGKPITFHAISDGDFQTARINIAALPHEKPTPIVLSELDKRALFHQRWDAFQLVLLAHLRRDEPLAIADIGEGTLRSWSREGRTRGFKVEKANYNYVRARIHAEDKQVSFEQLPNQIDDWSILTELDRSYELLRHLGVAKDKIK